MGKEVGFCKQPLGLKSTGKRAKGIKIQSGSSTLKHNKIITMQ